jgi:hypothetical protein
VWGVRKRTTKRTSMFRFTCVEPCIHNTPIYRQMWAQTAPAFSGPAKTGHTKGPHLTGPLLNADGMAPAHQAIATPLGARSPHDQPMGSGPKKEGKRGDHGVAMRCDDWPWDSTAPTLRPAIKTGRTPSRHHWHTPKAENAGRWMGHPGQGSSRPSPAAPRL